MREFRTSGSVGASGSNPRGDPTLFLRPATGGEAPQHLRGEAETEMFDQGGNEHRCRIVSAADKQEHRDEQARDDKPSLAFLAASSRAPSEKDITRQPQSLSVAPRLIPGRWTPARII